MGSLNPFGSGTFFILSRREVVETTGVLIPLVQGRFLSLGNFNTVIMLRS